MLSIIDSDTARSTILRRVNLGDEAIPDSILDRIQTTFGERLSPQEAVTRILHEVRTLGDEALRSWTEKLDGKAPGAFRVPRDSLLAALGSLSQEERTALELSNLYGLEHLCLAVSEPWAWSEKVMSAGGIFMGEYSFEVLGDYVAGPSHVMPTSGTARFASPLNVWDFVRIISLVVLNEEAGRELSKSAALIARLEGLEAHARSADQRTVIAKT